MAPGGDLAYGRGKSVKASPPREIQKERPGPRALAAWVGGRWLREGRDRRGLGGEPTAERVGVALAVAAVAVMVLTIVAGIAALPELSALVAIVGAVLAVGRRIQSRRAKETAEQDKSRLARQVQTIADCLDKSQSRHKDRAATAAADRETIVTLLA